MRLLGLLTMNGVSRRLRVREDLTGQFVAYASSRMA
jgi:hypothetical protein